MNEVRPTPVTASTPGSSVTRAASSPGADGADKKLPPSGDPLPVKDSKPEAKETQEPKETKETKEVQLKTAVTEINDYVQSIQRDLHFSVDEDSGATIIRVRDKESGELIRQIPEDIFLNLAQKLKDNQTLHLFDAHG